MDDDGEYVLNPDIFRYQGEPLVRGKDITANMLRKKNLSSAELAFSRMLFASAQESLKNIRKALPVLLSFLDEHGNPLRSGWDFTRVWEAVLDDLHKQFTSPDEDEIEELDVKPPQLNTGKSGDAGATINGTDLSKYVCDCGEPKPSCGKFPVAA